MKLADTIHCWEDTAYVLLGDSPIDNDSERTKKFENSRINFYAAEVSILKYSNDMKVSSTLVIHIVIVRKSQIVCDSYLLDRKQWFLYMVFSYR